jgi:hypothetical protein
MQIHTNIFSYFLSSSTIPLCRQLFEVNFCVPVAVVHGLAAFVFGQQN